MSWAGLGNTDFVTNANILDAIGMAVMTLKPGKSVSNNNNFITKAEAYDKLNIAALPGLGTNWPVKQDLMPLGWRGFIGVECLTNENRIHGTSVHFYRYDNDTMWHAGMTIVSDLPFLSAQEIEVFDNNTGLLRIDTETYEHPMAHAIFTTVPGQILTGYIVIYDGPTIYHGVSSTSGYATVIPALIDGYAVSKEEIEVNTGYRGYRRLEQYNLTTGNSVNVWKQNVPSDPDYIEPVYDPSSCPLPKNYHPVSGCYYYQDIGSSEYVCSIYGNETYYNTTGASGWNIGDIIYGKYGSVYESLAGWDTESYLSYTEGGVRKWLKVSFTGGVVIDMGTCNAYYAIPGCYLDAMGADGASVCAAGWGSEILYSTSSGEGWEIGDYVYRDLGQTGVGPYEIVTSTTGYEVFISYARLGGRSYVGLDVDMNAVYTIGTCAILQDTIIYTVNPRISGFHVILDLTSTRNLTSNVTIYVNVHGQWGGATAGASLTFNMGNGMHQNNNYLFNIEEYEGFFEDEPITVSVTDWDPRYDSHSRYDVG